MERKRREIPPDEEEEKGWFYWITAHVAVVIMVIHRACDILIAPLIVLWLLRHL